MCCSVYISPLHTVRKNVNKLRLRLFTFLQATAVHFKINKLLAFLFQNFLKQWKKAKQSKTNMAEILNLRKNKKITSLWLWRIFFLSLDGHFSNIARNSAVSFFSCSWVTSGSTYENQVLPWTIYSQNFWLSSQR